MSQITNVLNSTFWINKDSNNKFGDILTSFHRPKQSTNYNIYKPQLKLPQIWSSRSITDRLQISTQVYRNELKNLSIANNLSIKTNQQKPISHFDLDITNQLLLVSFDSGLIQMYDFKKSSPYFDQSSVILENSGVQIRSKYKRYVPLFFSIPKASRVSVTCAKWYPFDSELFVTSSLDGYLKVWDTDTIKSVTTYNFKKSIFSLDFSTSFSTSCLVCGLEDSSIRLCDLRLGNTSQTFTGHRKTVSSVAWRPSHDYHIASGSEDHSVFIWDIRKGGTPLFECNKLVGQEINKDYKLFEKFQNKDIFKRKKPKINTKDNIIEKSDEEINNFNYLNGNNFSNKKEYENSTSISSMDTKRVHNLGQQLNQMNTYSPLKFSDQLNYLKEGQKYLQNMNNYKYQSNFSNQNKNLNFDKQKSMNSIGLIQKSNLLHCLSNKKLKALAHDGPVSAILYSHNGYYLYSSAKDGIIRKWSADNGNNQWINFGFHDSISARTSQFSIDSSDKYLFHYQNKNWSLHETETGKNLNTYFKDFQAHTKNTCKLIWNPTRHELYTGALDGSLIIWKKNWHPCS